MGKVIELTNDTLPTAVSTTLKPVLIEFYSPDCPHCKAQDSVLNELADEFKGKALIAKFNINNKSFEHTELGIPVVSTPSIIVTKRGVAVEHVVGRKDKEYLEQLINKHITEKG